MTIPQPPRTQAAPQLGLPGAWQNALDWSVLPAPRVLAFSNAGGSQQLLQGQGLILFACWRETTGSAGMAFNFRDGTDTTGLLLSTQSVAESLSGSINPCAPGIPYRAGVYLQFVSGAFVGSLTYVPLPPGALAY